MNIHIQKDFPHKGFVDNTFVSIDTEWFGLKEGKLHRPGGMFALMTICAAPGFVYYINDPESIKPALDRLDNCVWIMQNAKFDIIQLRQYVSIPPRTRLIDTMLIERILWNGYYDTFSLDSMVRRYLDEEREDKSYWQKWFAETTTGLTPEAINYACQDADDQLRVWLKQKKYLTKTDMRVWREIDQPALWAVMDFQGFRIDPEKWSSLAERNKQKVAEIDQNLVINPRSPKQVLNYLKELGFKTLKSTGEKELKKAIRKYPKATEAIAIANHILTSRKYTKRASTYGTNFLDNMVEEVSGMHLVFADWETTGAETGRMAAKGGMQNIPIRETPEFRECFIARPGHKIVILDFDGQEARITGYLTQDKTLIDIFRRGKKVYIVAAEEIFGKKDIKKGDPEYSKMKSTFLGMDYGMSYYGLADRENITKEEAIGLIEDFFNMFPGIERWVKKQQEEKRITYTVFGRKAYLNPYSDQCPRNALNNPHQGTAADITKRALGLIYKYWSDNFFPTPFGVVGVYHDEIVLDVPEKLAQQVLDFCSDRMVYSAEAICSGMVFKVDATIADNWSEKQ